MRPGWREGRIGHICRTVPGFPFNSDLFAPSGDLPLVRIRDLTASEFETFVPAGHTPDSAILDDGDVVIGMDGEFIAYTWARGRAALNQRLCMLKETIRSDRRFLFYAVQQGLRDLHALAPETTVKHVSMSEIRGLRIAVPPLPEQRAIATYLDRETAEIDALVAAQEDLIETLRERRAAVVETAYVRDGSAPLVRIASLLSPRVRPGFPSEEPLSVYREHGVVRRADRDDNHNRLSEDLSRYILVDVGDVAMNRMKAWQGSLGVSPYRGIVSPDYDVLALTTAARETVDARWLHQVIRSRSMIGEYASRSTGIREGQWRLPWGLMREIKVPLPPLDEQRAIAAYLDEKTAEIDALIAETQEFIALAKERRAALITAAVTGQIDCTHLIEREERDHA